LEAFLYAEEARSRLLRDQLGVLRFPPPEAVPAFLIEEEADLLRRLRENEIALREMRDEARRQGLVDETATVRERLRALWDKLARDYGASGYVALRRGEILRWSDLQDWLVKQPRKVAIVEFFASSQRVLVFIVRPGEPEPRVVIQDIPYPKLQEIVTCFLREVHGFDLKMPTETWQEPARDLIRGLLPHLERIDLLYLIPHRALHYLPIHALEIEGEPLLARFSVVYVPSVAVALRVTSSQATPQEPSRSRAEGDALVVGNPTGDLRFAEEEAVEVARCLGTQPIRREAVTKSTLCSALVGRRHVHFAGHAYFDPREPFASGLICAGDEVLTAREVLSQRLDLGLLVLSACETGLQKTEEGDELIGLARSFLYAGARALVLSLWQVDDPVTKELMVCFYNHLIQEKAGRKMAAVDALREAMLEVRQRFPQTYLWAPFILIGDWR
jgi:CHAT domain-containing protein